MVGDIHKDLFHQMVHRFVYYRFEAKKIILVINKIFEIFPNY